MRKKIEAVVCIIIIATDIIIMPTAEERFWKYVNKDGRENDNMSRCWKWIGSINNKGYGQFNVNYKLIYAHRYSYAIHNPYGITLDDIEGCDCCHECDNRACINPDHLFLGSRKDNVDDMLNKNRQANLKGEQSGRAKLNQAQVIEIRNRYKNEKISYKKLGIEYGVGETTIRHIINNKIWKHITTE